MIALLPLRYLICYVWYKQQKLNIVGVKITLYNATFIFINLDVFSNFKKFALIQDALIFVDVSFYVVD